jgi:hypothetical protein
MVLFAHMSVHLVSEDFFLSKKNQISFTAWKPADWLVCCWLQLFGYPTGLGALLVRNGKHKFHIPWLYGSSYSCRGTTNLVAPFKFPEITDKISRTYVLDCVMITCFGNVDRCCTSAEKEVLCWRWVLMLFLCLLLMLVVARAFLHDIQGSILTSGSINGMMIR